MNTRQPKMLVIAPFPPSKAPEADHAYYLSEHLAEAGWHVDVLTDAGSVSAAHPRVAVHPVMRDWSWSELPRFAQVLRDCRPDAALLVYMGWVYRHHPMITFAPTLAKRLRPSLRFLTLFEGAYGALAYDGLSRAVRAGRRAAAQLAGDGVDYNYGTLLRDSDHVLTLCAEHEAALCAHFPALPDKSTRMPVGPLLRLCPNESDARGRGRELLGVHPNELLVSYFGYVYPGKGVETLLRAFQLASAEWPRLRLALVGGVLTEIYPESPRSYSEELRELAAQLGVADKVRWTGGFEHDSELPSLYLSAADACVLPFDGGVKLNNSSVAAAAAHGLPIITTSPDAANVAPFIDGQTVLLCPPKDPASLAEAIRQIAAHPDLRAYLRRGARQLAADYFSWANAVSAVRSALQLPSAT